MKSFTFTNDQRIFGKTITKGTQEKYYSDGYFYKIDTTFNEGLTEYLVTLLLKHTTLNSNSYMEYELCLINNKFGCRSKSFLKDVDEEFVTINSLYTKATGYTNLADYLMGLSTAEARLKYLLDLITIFNISKQEFRYYLNTLLQLDMLILNTDRHVHNYGVIYNRSTRKYRIPPIFDNGQSLNIEGNVQPISCTLSGSFEAQVVAFGYPIQPCFHINYISLKKDLESFKMELPNLNKVEILIKNLEKYKDIFDINNESSNTNFFIN